MPERRRPPINVIVFQCQCGTGIWQRVSRFDHPRSRAIFVETALSSMKFRRGGRGNARPCSVASLPTSSISEISPLVSTSASRKSAQASILCKRRFPPCVSAWSLPLECHSAIHQMTLGGETPKQKLPRDGSFRMPQRQACAGEGRWTGRELFMPASPLAGNMN